MNKVIISLVVLLSIAAIAQSQFTDCVSGSWTWEASQQVMNPVTYIYSWVWHIDSNPVDQANHIVWCGNNCVGDNGDLHSACTFEPAPIDNVTPLHLRCFCSGNGGEQGPVQSGLGACEPGFTSVDGVCVENCLVDPADNCATCTSDHELCATCVPGFFLKNGACVSDCGDGFYGSKLDWTCYECGYHWVGRKSTPDSWCYSNCFVPTTVSGLASSCSNANAAFQTCKCICPPDNTPNFVVGGAASVEQACKVNTYQDVIAGSIPYGNIISGWWLPYKIKSLWAAFGNGWCYNNCPGANCNFFCDPL